MMEDVARDIARFMKFSLYAIPIMAAVIVGLVVTVIVMAVR